MAARITGEAFERLRLEVSRHDHEQTRAKYRAGDIARIETVKDIDMRYRWDVFHFANRISGYELGDMLKPYTFDHIDTALRKIVPPLEVMPMK